VVFAPQLLLSCSQDDGLFHPRIFTQQRFSSFFLGLFSFLLARGRALILGNHTKVDDDNITLLLLFHSNQGRDVFVAVFAKACFTKKNRFFFFGDPSICTQTN